jgi:hypothetical protein
MLPKLTHRVVNDVLPSNQKRVKFRPMQAREEKLLLTAKEGEDGDEILSTVKQVVQNCLIDPINVDLLPIFDIEWLFIKIRIASVSNIVPVSYIDKSDGNRYDFEVDLDKVTIDIDETIEKHITLNDDISVSLRWPPVGTILREDILRSKDDDWITHQLALRSIDQIFDGDRAIPVDQVEESELVEFVDSFDLEPYKKLVTFASNIPSLSYTIEYTNTKGEERRIHLNSLTDFFTFR